jgi:flagellin-specific chaperone FliS
MHTAELEQSLNDSKVFPMVKDLCYKYDLRVSQRLMLTAYKYDNDWQRGFAETKDYEKFNDINYSARQDEQLQKDNGAGLNDTITLFYNEAFVLDYQGIPQAVVYFVDGNFCFQANYHIKDRGKDTWDRYTITSNKVSQVLKTLRRKEWKPLSCRDNYQAMKIDTKDMIQNFGVEGVSLAKAISEHRSAISDLTYDNKDKLSEILDSLYGNKNSISHATNEHYTRKFEETENLNTRVHSTFKEVKAELDNKFTAIGITNSGGWIVGEAYEHQGDYKIPNGQDILYAENNEVRNFKQYDKQFGQLIIHKTQRVRNLEQLDLFDSLKPTLTMLKVYLQDWEDKEDRNEVVREYFKGEYGRYDDRNWIEELGCYYADNTIYGAKNNPFQITWLLMAKPQ